MGIVVEKANQPKTIQERFANYHFNEKTEEEMKEIETGPIVGEEKW